MSRKRRQPPARRITQRQQLSEATAFDAALNGVSIDDDDWMYRPITGSRGDSLPEFQQERMFAIAKHLFRSNPVGSRYISLYTDFVLGEGATPTFQNSAVEAVVMRHWRDPYNDWERAQHDYFQHYLIFGELLVPLFPNKGSGHLRVGLQLVENIKDVHADPENWRVIESVRMKSNTGGDDGTLYTIVNTREDRTALAKANPALYWTRGNPLGERGLSVFYAIADLLDMMDQFVFSEIERGFLLKAFVWHAKVTGATDEQIAKLVQDPAFGPPKPGSVRVTNDRVEWNAVNPRLDTYDAWNGIKALRNHTGGAVGLPEHWFAEGGDVNRATAAEMDAPTLKRLTMVQREWRQIMVDVMQAQIDYAVEAGALPEMVAVERDGEPTDEMIPARDAVDIALPDLSESDNSQVVSTLDTLGRALSLAMREGLISAETAKRVYLTNVQLLGVEINITDEMERIAKDQEEREQEEQAEMERLYNQNPPANLSSLPAPNQRRDVAAGD